jgi:hypothetical protein
LAPGEPQSHRAIGAVTWPHILFLRDAVTVDYYLGNISKPTVTLRNSPADLNAEFREHIARGLALAEQRMAAAPSDASA